MNKTTKYSSVSEDMPRSETVYYKEGGWRTKTTTVYISILSGLSISIMLMSNSYKMSSISTILAKPTASSPKMDCYSIYQDSLILKTVLILIISLKAMICMMKSNLKIFCRSLSIFSASLF